MPPSPLGTREHLERSRRAGDEGIDLNFSHSRTHRLNIFPHPAPSPGGRGKIPLPSPEGEGFTNPLAGTLEIDLPTDASQSVIRTPVTANVFVIDHAVLI